MESSSLKKSEKKADPYTRLMGKVKKPVKFDIANPRQPVYKVDAVRG